MTEAGDADRIIRTLGGAAPLIDKLTAALDKAEKRAQALIASLGSVAPAAASVWNSIGADKGGSASFGGAGATTKANPATFGGNASAAAGLADNAPKQTQATFTPTEVPQASAPTFTSAPTPTSNAARFSVSSTGEATVQSPVSKDVALFGGSSGGGGSDSSSRGPTDWGQVGARAGSVVSAASGVMPSVALGINRKEDSFFASMVSTGGSGLADSNRNTIRNVLGDRQSGANSDMEVLSVAEKTHMGSKISDQQVLAEAAGYSAQMFGVTNAEGAEAAQDVWSAKSSNYLMANYGIQTTDAKGARKSIEDISAEFADTLKAQNPNMDAETLDQFAQSGAVELPEMLMRNVKSKWAADEMGVEWSMDANSEYAKATGADQTTTAVEMREHSAQTEYADKGADSASTGYEAASKASTLLVEGLTAVYDAAGPAAEALQQLRGAATQVETNQYGTTKAVVDTFLPSFMESGKLAGMVGVGGTTGYSEGAWDIPKDMSANLHTGELVLPTTIAQSVRSALAGETDGKKNFTNPTFSAEGGINTAEDAYTAQGSSYGGQTTDALGMQRPIGDVLGEMNNNAMQASVVGSGAASVGWSDNFAPEDAEQSGNTGLLEELKKLLGMGDKEGEGGYTLEDFLTESKDVVASQTAAAEALSASASELSDAATSLTGGTAEKAPDEEKEEPAKEGREDPLSKGAGAGTAKPKASSGGSESAKPTSKAPVKGEAPKATNIKKQDKLSFAKSSFSVDDRVSYKKISGSDMGGANTRLSLGMGDGTAPSSGAAPGATDAGGAPPANYTPGGGAEQWRPVILKALNDLGLPASYADGIVGQLNSESSGDPNAVNDNDSNWQQGTASFGLMQTIASTYQNYAPPGKAGTIVSKMVNGKAQQFVPEMVDPYNNIYAGINYVKGKYGLTKFDKWNAGQHGPYSEGAWRVPGDQIAKIHDGEMILPTEVAEKVRSTVRSAVSGIDSSSGGRGVVNVHVTLNNASYSEATRLIQVVKEQIQTVSDDEALVSR